MEPAQVLRVILWCCVGLLLMGGCATSPQPAMLADPDRTLADAFAALEQEGFSGTVLVLEQGRERFRASAGWANAQVGEQIGPDTVFHIGSITKSFTAAAILALEGDGLLDVHDPLSRFFPDVPADKAGITLHQLLTHTAGLPDRAVPCSLREAGHLDRDGFVSVVMSATLEARPGKRYLYSNTGYDLLGAIIEQLAGQDFETVVRSRLLQPAGMADTGMSPATWDDPGRIAVGYRSDGQPWGTLHSLFWTPSGALVCNAASGGLLSTIDDLARWMQALESGAVLAPGLVDRMWQPHVAEDRTGRVHAGYGFSVLRDRGGRRTIAHTGSINRILEAELRLYPDAELLLVVAGNSAKLPATEAAARLDAIMRAWSVSLSHDALPGLH